MLSTRQALRRLPVARWPKPRSIIPLHRDLATPATPSPNDPFANGTNAYYADEMYKHWRQDPKSVHVSWDVYFSGLDKGLTSPQAFQPPPNLPAPADGAPALHAGGGAELDDHLKVSCPRHPALIAFSSYFRVIRSNCSFVLTKSVDITSPSWIPSESSTLISLISSHPSWNLAVTASPNAISTSKYPSVPVYYPTLPRKIVRQCLWETSFRFANGSIVSRVFQIIQGRHLKALSRRCRWYPVCPHPRQGAVRLDQRTHRNSKTLELHR